METSVLSNGMTIVSETMPQVRSVSLGLWFNVGSRDELPDQAGLTHFMEHMMFKGTPTRTPLDISMHFDRLGAELNAFTSKEYTCYYARFVDDKLPSALEVLADMVVNSTFSQEAIDTEREVVLEEIARAEDAPDDFVFDLYTSSTLPGHPVGLPVLGSKERVGAYRNEDCRAFHAEHYHAGNLTIAAAGNVDHASLVALAESLFSTLPAGTKASRTLEAPSFADGIFVEKRDIEQAHLVYGLPWLPVGDERRFATSLMTTLLGGSMSSRLFQVIREDRGLAYSVYATQSAYQGAGQWCVYAGTRPGNISEVVGLIKGEIARLVQDPVPADELERTCELICGQMLLGLESTSNRMVRLGKRQTLGLEHLTPEEQVERYRSVTVEDVLDLAQDLLTADAALACVSPLSSSEVTALVS